MTDSPFTAIEELKWLVDLLDRLGITPLHLHVDTRATLDQRPRVHLALASRSDFERFVEAAGVQPVERPAPVPGRREWFAEADAPAQFLVQAVSFVHHHDWLPCPEVGSVAS